MTVKLTPETWAQVRYEYEHTDKPVDEICLDHGVSPSTLRDRVRRWRWTPRHEPVPAEGPPPMMPVAPAAPLLPAIAAADVSAPFERSAAPLDGRAGLPAPEACVSEEAPPDPAEIVPRLQSAVARVLPAIEATLGKLAGGPMRPLEMERAARTLTALTRTLRELNELLSQHQARAACDDDDDTPEDIDAFRLNLARRIEALVDSQTSDAEWELRGRPPEGFVPYGA